MGMDAEDFFSEEVLTSHRVLLFRFTNPVTFNESAARQRLWHHTLASTREAPDGGAPQDGGLAGIADATFPAQLDSHTCERLAWGENATNGTATAGDGGTAATAAAATHGAEASSIGSLPEDPDALAAYAAACDIWRRYAGNTHEHYSDDWRDYDDYDPNMDDRSDGVEGSGDEDEVLGEDM